jgi:hypothetical protein
MNIKKFSDFINESEQSEEVKNALKILKNSGYDIKKIPGEKPKIEFPKFDDLMKIPEFSKIKEKFGLEEHDEKEYPYHRTNPRRATIIYSDVIGNEKGPVCLRIGSNDKDHITVSIKKGIKPEDFRNGIFIIRNEPFGTVQEKRSVFSKLEKYLYCAAINMGGTASKNIIDGVSGDKLGPVINAYKEAPINDLTSESLYKVMGMINEINPRRFALMLENIPDNKAMDMITAVLDNPKISAEMMKYLEANPASFDDPAKIIRRYKSK